MIISMSDILCVTNRSLCKEDFLVRIEKIAKTEAAGIILREKDLSEEEYQALAEKILTICQKQKMQCILHAHTNVARKLAYNAMASADADTSHSARKKNGMHFKYSEPPAIP